MDKLIITKSLRSGYKNPNSIAHKVLADRITKRDPGNKPSSGDRIPYVYINSLNKKSEQKKLFDSFQTYNLKESSLSDAKLEVKNLLMNFIYITFDLIILK